MALWPFILGGGSGSRLWPLSRRAYPKQFHTLVTDRSLLSESLSRLRLLSVPDSRVGVICHVSHADRALLALDEAGFGSSAVLLEPEGRNTAAAAVLACMWALSSDEEAVVALMPSDHHIARPESLIEAIGGAVSLAADGRMVVFGIRPDRPETGYGYIERGAPMECGYSVARFVEKPDERTAREYLASGRYYWNAGIFLLHAGSYLRRLGELRPDIALPASEAFAAMERQGRLGIVPMDLWGRTASESIDYAYAEHSSEGVVVPVDAGWSDVGSWSALHDLADADAQGNVVRGKAVMVGAHGSYVRSRTDRVIAVVGVDDLVVVDTKDAVLIARRNGSDRDMRELSRILAIEHPDLL